MSLHILVISDYEPFAAYLCELLCAAGHEATSVLEGKEVFRAIRRQKPDLLILAVEATKVAALAVEHRLHTPEGPRTVPVIVVSECLRLEAELLHIFDFIPKPIDVNRLLDDAAAIALRRSKTESAVPTDRQYLDFSGHILSCTGLHFEARNRSTLERGLGKRMTALRIESCDEYLTYLKRHGEDRHELQKLLQFLTVGETYFFRYPSHFDALKERLTEMSARPGEPIRIWSAGCSTGEEPYSIAITVMEALPDWKTRDIKIIATDINNRSLKQARDAVYTPWSMRTTDPRCQKRYFDRVGESFLLKDEVKRLVVFSHLNLSAPCNEKICADLQHLDAIFCRNVLIYFSPEQATLILRNLSARLEVSGQLFLGHAETLFQRCLDLEVRRRESSFYYVKSGESRQEALPASPVPPRAPLSHALSPPPPPPTPPIPIPTPTPTPTPAARLEAARQLFDEEDFDAAYRLLETLLKEHPNDTGALILKGFILAGKGRFEEALVTCCRVIGLNDLLPEAYFLKGVVLDATERLAEAADEYRKALLLDNDFIMPRYHMGRLHLRLGKVPEAAREIRNSLKILARRGDEGTIPFSGGLTRTVCMMQLQNALAQVA